MTVNKLIKNQGLIQAFKRYQKRYLNMGKKIATKQSLSEVLYRTMRLEGEKISRKAAQALFR